MNFRKKTLEKVIEITHENHKELEKNTVLRQRYKIKETIGNGEFSIVYLAYDQILLQDVAIKELISAEYEENFIHEAKMLFGKYEWNGFPEIKDVFRENEKVYLVMEYISGKNLREYVNHLPQHRIKAEDAVKMLLPVMSALEFLHAEKGIHCGISMDKIFLREDESCCLLGVGTGWAEWEFEESFSKPKAPEVAESKAWTGPWSDVWGICAVLYEMISGKSVVNDKGIFHEDLKDLADFVEIDGQIAQAISQGLNSSIQQRFFCISTFLERFKKIISGDLKEKYKNLFQNLCLGKIQAVWGEKWLEITTSDQEIFTTGRKKEKFLWTRRRKKNAAVVGFIAGLVVCGMVAGAAWYGNQPVTKEHLLRALENIDTKQEYSDAVIYTVSKDFVKENHLRSDLLYKFAIKKEDLKNTVENCLKIELPETSSVHWNGNIYVYHDYMQRTEIGCYEKQQYQMEYQGENIALEWKYDVTDEYVTAVAFTGEKDIEEKIIKELLPVLVPGAYLTEEEIENCYKKADEEYGYYRMKTHGKYVLTFDHHGGVEGEPWEIVFENYLDPKRDSRKKEEESKGKIEEKTVRAGNYERDSEEYEKYIEFLENSAIEKEETEEKVIYTLDEETVKEWGKPCNKFFLDLTVDELIRNLENQGITLKKETRKEELGADIYPGGAIQTRFFTREKYAVSDNTKLFIISDYISGEIFSIYVYDEKNDRDHVADMSARILELISEDVEIGKTEENFKNQLEEMEIITAEPGNESYTMMASLTDCGYSLLRVNDYEHLCVFFEHHSFSFEENGYAPYNWS